MCCMCLERVAVFLVECEVRQVRVNFRKTPDLFLQEATDIIGAIQQLEKLSLRPNYSSYLVGGFSQFADILLCRLLDLYWGENLTPEHLSFLSLSRVVRKSIFNACAPLMKDKFLGMQFSFLQKYALKLYESKTYLPRVDSPQALPCFPTWLRLEVLEHFLNWWLKGKDLELLHDTFLPEFAAAAPKERERFSRLFRLFYLALIQTENTPKEQSLLRKIVIETPTYSTNLDLWLKRKALAKLALWDPAGIPVLENENRDILYYYAALKNTLPIGVRKKLAFRIEAEGCVEGAKLLRGSLLKDVI